MVVIWLLPVLALVLGVVALSAATRRLQREVEATAVALGAAIDVLGGVSTELERVRRHLDRLGRSRLTRRLARRRRSRHVPSSS